VKVFSCMVIVMYWGCQDDVRCVSGYWFKGIVRWSSKEQSVTGLSTAEAEYIALSLLLCKNELGSGI